MIMKIKYNETASFKKDFKKLNKKFKTLITDMNIAKKYAIELFHLNKIDNHSIVSVPGYNHEFFQIYKLRKFACKALKGKGARSGIRVIYAYNINTNTVIFIEMYFKANQENEDKKRIKNFLC